YGEEFTALLEAHPTSARGIADVIVGAVAAHVRSVRDAIRAGGGTWDARRQDLRYATRGLMRQPGFTLAVIATLALGIGANASMFGIIDRLLFRPPAFLSVPDRAARFYGAQLVSGKEVWNDWFGYRQYLDLRELTRSFDAMTPFEWDDRAVGDGEATHVV